MPQDIRIVNQQFFYQSRNGDNFDLNTSETTLHLKGNVGERVKAVYNVQLNWYTQYEANSIWHYFDDEDYNPTLNEFGSLVINANGFETDGGFVVGDYFRYTGGDFKAVGVITSVSDTEIYAKLTEAPTLEFTSNPNLWRKPSVETFVTGTTTKRALKYKFGIIENNESFNTLSKLTNTDQTFYVDDIQHPANPDDPWTPVYTSGFSHGNNKAWETGTIKAAFIGYSFDKDRTISRGESTLEYAIEHEFIILPYYRNGEEDSLTGSDQPPLDLYNGDKSLKYVFEAEFRTEVNNPNTSVKVEYDTQDGSVGYFNESYNGFPNRYSVRSVSYEVGGETVEKLDASNITNVTLVVDSLDGVFNSNTVFVIGHSLLLDQTEYQRSEKKFKDLWVNNSVRNVFNAAAKNDGVLKNVVNTSSTSTSAEFNFDVDPTSENIEDLQEYILTFSTEETNKSIDLSGKVNLLVDYNTYSKSSDIDGLWNVEKFEQYPHAEDFEKGVTTGFANAKGFNETGYFTDITVKKDNEATLEDLFFEFVVYNTVTKQHYTLRTFEFDLSSSFLANGIQNIELDTDRGYILKGGDLFNIVKIETVGNNSIETEYSIQLGFKTAWQSWLKWDNAPSDFYDKTKPQFNLNQKSSTYSEESSLNDYELRVFLKANVSKGGIVTEYINSSGKFDVFDYDTDDLNPDGFTCEINTFNKEGEKIEGNLIKQDFTELRAIFTPSTPPVFTQTVDMTEVSTGWGRFAHGNKCALTAQVNTRMNGGVPGTGSAVSIAPAQNVEGSWDNNQAGIVDGVLDSMQGLGYVFYDLESISFQSTESTIQTTDNIAALYGCHSIDMYEYYEINGEMYSSSNDNDGLAYNIAFHTDENGVEHTLSLCATTGGILLDKNPSYIEGDINTNVFLYNPPAPDNVVQWALVYNWGKSDCKQLNVYRTTNPNTGWGSLNQITQTFNFNVKRSGSSIEIQGDWSLPSGVFSDLMVYDLNDNEETKKFKGFQKIGFSFQSQNQGGFKNVALTLATGDYYGILRIEPEESQSDFGISELSTVNEAPENNLLTQITGTEKLSTLSYDGNSFVLQGEVDTNKVEEGQKYKLSAELRQLNLDS